MSHCVTGSVDLSQYVLQLSKIFTQESSLLHLFKMHEIRNISDFIIFLQTLLIEYYGAQIIFGLQRFSDQRCSIYFFSFHHFLQFLLLNSLTSFYSCCYMSQIFPNIQSHVSIITVSYKVVSMPKNLLCSIQLGFLISGKH